MAAELTLELKISSNKPETTKKELLEGVVELEIQLNEAGDPRFHINQINDGWIPITEDIASYPEHGIEVLGFNKEWIDEDFNPDGICMCFVIDDNWTISSWCGQCDEWHTAYDKNWTAHKQGEGHMAIVDDNNQVSEDDMSTKIMPAPTHWKLKPTPPIL